MAAQQDDEEDIFASIVKNNFQTTCNHDDDEDPEFAELLACMPCVAHRPANALPAQRSKPVHRHAFGQSCSTTDSDILATTTQNSSTDTITMEVDEETSGAAKLVIFRGKKTRGSIGQKETIGVKKTRFLDNEEIAAGLVPCCPKRCNEQFTFSDLEDARTHFWGMKANEQGDWLTRELALHGHVDKDDVFRFRYRLNGKYCCGIFLEHALPMSHGRLSQMRTRVLSKNLENSKRQQGGVTGHMADKTAQFIRTYATDHGEGLPNKIDVDLPAGCTKEEVYIEYLLDHEGDSAKEAGSLSWWYKTWRSRCFHIKAKEWNRFSKCTTCSNIKALKGFCDSEKQGELASFAYIINVKVIL